MLCALDLQQGEGDLGCVPTPDGASLAFVYTTNESETHRTQRALRVALVREGRRRFLGRARFTATEGEPLYAALLEGPSTMTSTILGASGGRVFVQLSAGEPGNESAWRAGALSVVLEARGDDVRLLWSGLTQRSLQDPQRPSCTRVEETTLTLRAPSTLVRTLRTRALSADACGGEVPAREESLALPE